MNVSTASENLIRNSQNSNNASTKPKSKRFASLDFARGISILLMIAVHTLSTALNVDDLLSDLNSVTVINLVALVIIPFYGGLAGFFLLISSMSNMLSMYRDFDKGNSVKSVVLKQVIGGVLLLVIAMLIEGLIGYRGAFGNFFKYFLDRPGEFFQYSPFGNSEGLEPVVYNWQTLLWRWNRFETIHTIAWCLIINGITQGLLSIKKNWKNRKQLILIYALMAAAVVACTLPVWELVKVIIPGYPLGVIPETGNVLFTPVLGQDSWWRIMSAPFLNALAAPMEPLFPYLAVSFIGSIFGIALSKPKDKINKKFPRNMFLVGTTMFVAGLIGIVIVIIGIMDTQGFTAAINVYKDISYHRHWSPDNLYYIPMFAWLPQFLGVNGFSIMLLSALLRLVEFRGKGKILSDRTKIVRRFGTIALTNYNNQFIYYIVFCLTSYMITLVPYQQLFWAGTFLTIFLTLVIFSLLLWFWEKIGYVGSLEWLIRTLSNNLIPARRKRFDSSVKWWQKGKVDAQKSFYNPEWIDLSDSSDEEQPSEDVSKSRTTLSESNFALALSIVGLVTILFNAASIFGLFISINARKTEGKTKKNTAAFVISIIGCVFFAAFYIFAFSVKVGKLGLPL